MLPSKLKRLLKPEEVPDNHTERLGNSASEIFHDPATQPASPKAEGIPLEEGGDLEDEIGVNYSKTQVRVLLYNREGSTGSPRAVPWPPRCNLSIRVCVGRGRLCPEAALACSEENKIIDPQRKRKKYKEREPLVPNAPLVHFIQHCFNPSPCWRQGLGSRFFFPTSACSDQTPASFPPGLTLQKAKFLTQIEKVHCKTTESSSKSYRNDRGDRDDIHLLY